MSTLNKLGQATQDTLSYLWGGLSRIFAPPDDHYPNTGVQPFDGEPLNPHRKQH